MRTIKVKELKVPVDAMAEVAQIISENDITNSITGVDDDLTTVFVEVNYENEEKEFIKDIVDVIKEYRDENDDEEDDK